MSQAQPNDTIAWYDLPLHATPVMFTQLDGWIDAGNGADLAMRSLLDEYETTVIARLDVDKFLDMRGRRPVDRLADGVHESIMWPEITLRATEPIAGDAGALLLVGPEPDFAWHLFARTIVDACLRLNVRLACGFGAFPSPVPHTRPIGVATTAVNTPAGRNIAARIGFVPGTIDVPAGAQAVVEEALGQADITAVGLWARVPHYVANTPYPAAAVAILEAASQLTDLELPTDSLTQEADRIADEIQRAVVNNEEHVEMVRQLETAYDSGVSGVPRIVDGTLPTGDEIAAEFERFLRNQPDQ
jgi:hypothetical protein